MTGSDSTRPRRRPAAFRLDDQRVRTDDGVGGLTSGEARIMPEPDDAPAALPAPAVPGRRPARWGRLLAIGLGGLVTLAIGLAVDALIRDLFSRTDWLGWLGVVLAALAALGLLGLVVREVAALMRLGRIDRLRDTLAAAAAADDARKAKVGLTELVALYSNRPETAHGRRQLAGHMREVIDGRDLIVLAERELLRPLDQRARRIVIDSAKRVSVVTAVSPRALIDLMIVLFENLRVIRRLSMLYGGRPGFLGFLRLAREVAAHLAVTGGMAAGDSLLSQLLGHGLAARLSARLGEGIVNGLLTARIGIAAVDVCRPAPFVGGHGPTISDVMAELFKNDPEAAAIIEKAKSAAS